jgi:hypothetical protein
LLGFNKEFAMAPSKPFPQPQLVELMGEAGATMEEQLAAITANLNESRRLLTSCALRLGVKDMAGKAASTTSFASSTFVTPISSGILGLADMGHGPSTLGCLFGYKKRTAGTSDGTEQKTERIPFSRQAPPLV